MPHTILERKFSMLQTLIFKQIGNKLPTNSLKNIMDFGFVLIEKVGCKFEAISDLYLKLYNDIVTKEIAMAQISSQDSVLVIGSGSLPATPALIAQNTHAHVVSIDKDSTAVKEATQYVRSHHLKQFLTIHCADGLTYPVEQFTVIVVLYGVKQPAIVLKYLASRINQNARIILRMITDSHGDLTDKTIDLSQSFQIKDQVHSETLGSFDSFLLKKK
jgi:precorrin-6B methylase 2